MSSRPITSLLSVLQPLIGPVHDCMRRGWQIPAAATRAVAEHRDIAAAVQAHSPRRARAAVRRHLETSRDELMELLGRSPVTGGSDQKLTESNPRPERAESHQEEREA